MCNNVIEIVIFIGIVMPIIGCLWGVLLLIVYAMYDLWKNR